MGNLAFFLILALGSTQVHAEKAFDFFPFNHPGSEAYYYLPDLPEDTPPAHKDDEGGTTTPPSTAAPAPQPLEDTKECMDGIRAESQALTTKMALRAEPYAAKFFSKMTPAQVREIERYQDRVAKDPRTAKFAGEMADGIVVQAYLDSFKPEELSKHLGGLADAARCEGLTMGLDENQLRFEAYLDSGGGFINGLQAKKAQKLVLNRDALGGYTGYVYVNDGSANRKIDVNLFSAARVPACKDSPRMAAALKKIQPSLVAYIQEGTAAPLAEEPAAPRYVRQKPSEAASDSTANVR